MSRCQHGQVMSLYCINESCTWREAGGCENCFKRYHFHPTNVGTITNEQLDQLYRKMIIRPDPKVKSRILQQAVYNYFAIMKNHLSSSIDTISREFTNRLNYPYLCQADQFQTFNKIKNKEFRKLNKKQLKSFYEFASENSKQLLEEKQKQMYFSEVSNLKEKIGKINAAFCLYAEAITDLDHSFQVDQTFANKINEIASSVEVLLKEGKVSTRQGSNASSKSRGKRIQQVKIDSTLKKPPTPGSKDRDRKVSLDLTNQVSAFRVGLDNKNIENQITERKRRLMQLDNPPKNYDMDEIKVDLSQNTNNDNQGKLKQKQKIIQRSAQKHFPRDFSADKDLSNQDKDGRRKRNISKDTSDKQSQLHSEIVHTTLPRQASKPKLYEYSKDVKEKKFTVSVKLNEEQKQCASPLLKKKKTIAQNKGLNLFRVQSMSQQQRENQKQQRKEVQKMLESVEQEKQKKENQVDVLRQKQADSLALLISSLSTSAQQAIPLLEAALKYANSNLSAAQYLSYLYLQIGKPKECLSVCNQFLEQIQSSPQSTELAEHLVNNKAAALNMLGRYSESISILQKCLHKKQKDIYYKNLGDSYFSIGISEKAVLSYQKATQMNPEMDQAFFNLAVCLFVQGNFTQAKLNVQRALKLNIKNESYLQLNKQISAKLNI